MTSGTYPKYYIINLFTIISGRHTYNLKRSVAELDEFDSESWEKNIINYTCQSEKGNISCTEVYNE